MFLFLFHQYSFLFLKLSSLYVMPALNSFSPPVSFWGCLYWDLFWVFFKTPDCWLLVHIQEWAGPSPWSHGRMSSGAFVLENVAVNLTPLLVSDPCILVSPGLFSWATRVLLEKLSTRSPASERYELGASLFRGWSLPTCTVVLHVTCSFYLALLTPGLILPLFSVIPLLWLIKQMLTVRMQARKIWSQLKIFVCNTEAKIAEGEMDRLKICNFQDCESIY